MPVTALNPIPKAKGEGRVILLLAALMFGGALFMIGKAWYEKHQAATVVTSPEAGLVGLRFLSIENILDRIKKNEDIRFIDIRSSMSFESSHLIDSDWLTASELMNYSAPTGQLVIVIWGEENPNDQLREIHNRFSAKKMTFGFLEGGIRNWISRGGTVITKSDPRSYIDQTKVITVTPEQVPELRQSLVKSTVLDVRSDQEYAAGHIPGALNIPLVRIEKERGSIPAIGSLFVYGASEADTFQAGTQLFDMGFFGLRVITGGFESWQSKGLPIETALK